MCAINASDHPKDMKLFKGWAHFVDHNKLSTFWTLWDELLVFERSFSWWIILCFCYYSCKWSGSSNWAFGLWWQRGKVLFEGFCTMSLWCLWNHANLPASCTYFYPFLWIAAFPPEKSGLWYALSLSRFLLILFYCFEMLCLLMFCDGFAWSKMDLLVPWMESWLWNSWQGVPVGTDCQCTKNLSHFLVYCSLF